MFQFAAAIILICGLIVISKQIDFVKHRDLGFNTEHLLYLKINPMAGKAKALSDELMQYHGIKSLTETSGIPGDIQTVLNGYNTMVIDSATLETFGFKIIRGRNLLPGDAYGNPGAATFLPKVSKACLVNEEALKKFDNGEIKNHEIMGSMVVGVVSDFNYSSLYSKTSPLVLMYGNGEDANYITMRVSGPIVKQ